MKTQLLEDIGENAALPPAPFKRSGNSNTGNAAPNLAPAGPRPAPAAAAHHPVAQPAVLGVPLPDQEPTPLELDSVFEEIAALEAQYVAPRSEPEPALLPAEPVHQPAEPSFAPQPRPAAAVPPAPEFDFTPPAPGLQAAAPFPRVATDPGHPPLGPAAEAAPDPLPRQAAAVPPDPVFDFTPPAPALQAADPFTRAGSTRSRQRYLVWAACLLVLALLILGGRWFYQERNDAGSRARVADQAQAAPQGGKTVQLPAHAIDDAGATPAEPARPGSPAVPPMVMLERDASAAAKPARVPGPTPGQDQARTAPQPEPVAQQAPAAASPKPPSRLPARQPAGATAETGQPEVQDTSMTATLKACRQRGYDAAQCVKRGCSMTRYGFACRGQ